MGIANIGPQKMPASHDAGIVNFSFATQKSYLAVSWKLRGSP